VAEPFTLEFPEGPRWVIEPPHGPYEDAEIRAVTVEIRADDLAARTGAFLYSGQRPDLAGFFSDLAADWRGWAGKRRWASLEGEMAIEAWHDGRAHVMVAVTLRPARRAHAQDAWAARVVFTLEAGEQMTAVARELASLLGG
jgi:hypothetical protein